jgi:hypothetical protein
MSAGKPGGEVEKNFEGARAGMMDRARTRDANQGLMFTLEPRGDTIRYTVEVSGSKERRELSFSARFSHREIEIELASGTTMVLPGEDAQVTIRDSTGDGESSRMGVFAGSRLVVVLALDSERFSDLLSSFRTRHIVSFNVSPELKDFMESNDDRWKWLFLSNVTINTRIPVAADSATHPPAHGTRPTYSTDHIASLLADAVARQYTPEFMRAWREGQLTRVLYQLAKSVAVAAGAGPDSRFQNDSFQAEWIEEQKDRLSAFLRTIPPAFHYLSFPTTEGNSIALFELPPAEFSEKAKTIRDVDSEKLIRAYGTIWIHDRAFTELRLGEKGYSHREYWLEVVIQALEGVATEYLQADDFVSPLLERALVDALVYKRILEFAQYSSDGPLPPDPSEYVKLKLTKTETILSKAAEAVMPLLPIAVPLVMIIIEGLLLFGTWVLAGVVTSTSTEKWIVFTGFTAARWIMIALHPPSPKGWLQKRKARNQATLQMLWDMCLAHEHVPAMNVALLQHLFYRLEERGAMFSPYVFRILDKRARRESTTPAV